MTPLEILVLFSTFITVGFLNWLADYAESQCPAQSKPDEVPEEIPAKNPLTPKIPPVPTAPSVPATPRQPEEPQQPRKKIKQDLPLIIEYGVGPMP
jgi:hypothetical protein